MPVPAHRIIGGENRPAHGRESLGEEGSGELDDEMIGAVPGDKVLGAVVIGAAKTHEGGHLVTVALDGFFHLMKQMDIIIGDSLHEIGLAAGEAPEEAVEEGPALRVTMAGGEAGGL